MNKLTNLYNNEEPESKNNLYLSFVIGENHYAVPTENVMEIMKLPNLEYPQKLPNNFVGFLNYNAFTINVLDIRFYLDIKVTPYTVSNQLLIIKTDEMFFGLIINKVEDIFSLDAEKIERMPFAGKDKLIEFLYRQGEDSLSIINLYALESMIKTGVESSDIDIPSLFPQDDASRYTLTQRNKYLIEKSKLDLAKNIFAQDKFISFLINENFYCINLKSVKEFLKNTSITPIPCTPEYIIGLITLKGDYVTIIDIKNFLGANPIETEIKCAEKSIPIEQNRIIIVESDGCQVGFLVDEILNIIDIPEEVINQNIRHNLNKNILCELVIDKNPYTIIDISKIMSDERFYIEEN